MMLFYTSYSMIEMHGVVEHPGAAYSIHLYIPMMI